MSAPSQISPNLAVLALLIDLETGSPTLHSLSATKQRHCLKLQSAGLVVLGGEDLSSVRVSLSELGVVVLKELADNFSTMLATSPAYMKG